MKKEQISVFISYSHKDEEHKERLISHLSPLKRKGLITEWHDRKIIPGKEWQKEIDDKVRTADLILLLVSSDFVASEYCFEKELSIALERHESKLSVVLPIILRPTSWLGLPFAKLQSLPKEGLPISKWDDIDEACLDVVGGIQKIVQEITKFKNRPTEDTGLLKIHDILSSEIDRLDNAYEKFDTQTCSGVSTGIVDLDQVIDGLHAPDLIVIASRPSMGKTALALNIASNIAVYEKQPVAYFSMITPADKTTRRIVSIIGQIEGSALLKGDLHDDDWPRLTSAIAVLNEAPLFIDESILSSVDELRIKLIKFKNEHQLRVVIIDSLQDLAYKEKSLDKNILYSEYTHKLKHLAIELQLPIILTVSLPRNIEIRPNKRPLLSDLTEFEGLVNCADVITFLYRGEFYQDFNFIDGSDTELIVAKNNNGPVGTIGLNYTSKYSRFSKQASEYPASESIESMEQSIKDFSEI